MNYYDKYILNYIFASALRAHKKMRSTCEHIQDAYTQHTQTHLTYILTNTARYREC